MSTSIRKSSERGHADHGWLLAKHSFSFGSYRDPEHSGFGPLLVINEDRVAAGQGFGAHGHRDMEILTYVLEGELEHRDSMGNGSRLRYGDTQLMGAGTGVRHSEFNPSQDNPLRLLQIWIEPDKAGYPPSYHEAHFDPDSKRGRLALIASPGGAEGSSPIRQDAKIYASILSAGQALSFKPAPGRLAYLHLIRGAILANGHPLEGGDAIKLAGEPELSIEGSADAELLLFDLPAR